jgi:hypothetical protein
VPLFCWWQIEVIWGNRWCHHQIYNGSPQESCRTLITMVGMQYKFLIQDQPKYLCTGTCVSSLRTIIRYSIMWRYIYNDCRHRQLLRLWWELWDICN